MFFKLMPVNDSDFVNLLSWITSERALKQWAGSVQFTWPLDEIQLTSYFLLMRGKPAQAFIYKVIDEKTNIIVGYVELGKVDWKSGIATLSRVLVGPEYRGKGFSHEIVRLALDMAFCSLGFGEVILSVYTFNMAAIRCYTAAGFKNIKVLKNACNVGAESWDCQMMSISAAEYQNNKVKSGELLKT